MPRVSTKSTDEEVKPAPRKRAVRRVVAKDEAPAPRKRAPRKVTKADEAEVDTERERRAPTRFAEEATTRTKKRKTAAMVVSSMVVVTALAAWIGSTDAGQINVNEKIDAEANRQPQATQDVTSGEGSETLGVPVQNTPPAAISGLRGRGVGTAPVEQPAPPVEQATTTDETASTTDSASEGGEAESTQPEATSEPVSE